MGNFGYLNSLHYFTFILWQTCEKTLWRMYAHSWTFPLPHACQYAFSWAAPPPFKNTLSKTPWDNFLRQCCMRHCVIQLFVRECLDITYQRGKFKKENFFRKTIDISFMYLLTLFIVQNLKKKKKENYESWSRVMARYHFWAQNDPFALNNFFFHHW